MLPLYSLRLQSDKFVLHIRTIEEGSENTNGTIVDNFVHLSNMLLRMKAAANTISKSEFSHLEITKFFRNIVIQVQKFKNSKNS